jgi:predicted PurR-regulated permease PerM
MKFNASKELIFSILVLLIAVLFIYQFTSIVLYMLIAAIVAFIGQPLKHLIQRIKIKRWSPGNGLASALSMLTLIAVFSAIFVILVPAIANQANDLKKLDYAAIATDINEQLITFEGSLKKYDIIEQEESLEMMIQDYLTSIVSDIQISQIASNAFGVIGSVFMGLFSVLFISFFFVRDELLFQSIILLFIPESKKNNVRSILIKIRKMLSRYFVGLMTEISIMMVLESIGGFAIGLHNAILIGFLGGLLNIIPYIGPLLGGSLAVILVTISNISLGMDATLPLIYGIIIVFAVANMIDNFLLQPLIYSNSVMAHPLEIFIMIIVGGSIYGPMGMIVAIPVYTILRIIAKEFLGDQAFIQKVTKSL